MPTKIPKRDFIGRWTPKVIDQFSDNVGTRLKRKADAAAAAYTPSGLISGGKLANPTLWSVLDLLGLRKEYDEYTLGKFQRGHDVEARAINLLTGLEIQYIIDILDGTKPNPGWISIQDPDAVLSGAVYLQLQQGYRGGTGYIDLAQKTDSGTIYYHEIKSSNKMSYDKVSASGASASAAIKRGEKPTPDPYDHHQIQLAYYCLGGNVQQGFLHYFNADDYRMISFSINPLDYKEEIDKEIDDIQMAFESKVLPPFEALTDWHKIKNYQSYGAEWNTLNPDELLNKLRLEYPEAYQRFMTTTLPTK